MSSEPVIDESQPHAIVTARPVGQGFQVLVTMNRSRQEKGHGPWSVVVDEAPDHGGGTGPSPTNLAVAGLAA